MRALVTLVVVLSCRLRPAFGTTNDVHGPPGETLVAPLGHKSASQSATGGGTTSIPENVRFQHVLKAIQSNRLNTSSNGNLSMPMQQPASTNSGAPDQRTALAPMDVSAGTRVNQRQEYFSDQDKYGGVLYKAYRADNPLKLISPFAPREYGQVEAAELPRDPIQGGPSGFSVFSIRFK